MVTLYTDTQKIMPEGMKLEVKYPAVLSFEIDDEILALSNAVRIRVVATNDVTSSTLLSIEPNGDIIMATGISKKLGLNLDENGSLKVRDAGFYVAESA